MSDLTAKEALNLLKQYSCMQARIPSSAQEREKLQESLLLIGNLSTYQTIGVCANNSEEGMKALANYLKALGYPFEVREITSSDPQKGVYIKFNTEKMNYYLDSYNGFYRGVLIAYQGGDENIIGTYGHFPLNLFGDNSDGE